MLEFNEREGDLLFLSGKMVWQRLSKRVTCERKKMAIPTIDQTEGIWIQRTNNQGEHYIQAIFSKENPADQAHRSNCSKLIQRGSLQPEYADHLQPAQRAWDLRQRYHRVHI